MTQVDAGPTSQNRRSPRAVAWCLVGLGLFTWLDLATKDWAQAELSRESLTPAGEVCVPDDGGRVFMQRVQTEPIVLAPGYLELRYAENCGAAFGVLDDGPAWLRLALFVPAAFAAIGGLLWLFVTGYGGALFAWSVPLIASGALGNLVDRLRLGYVIDFIRFHVHDSFAWPTFNVADATITVGVVLLFIESLRAPRTAAAAPIATPSAEAKAPR